MSENKTQTAPTEKCPVCGEAFKWERTAHYWHCNHSSEGHYFGGPENDPTGALIDAMVRGIREKCFEEHRRIFDADLAYGIAEETERLRAELEALRAESQKWQADQDAKNEQINKLRMELEAASKRIKDQHEKIIEMSLALHNHIKDARDAALEEAAECCEEYIQLMGFPFKTAEAISICEMRIRALKGAKE